MITQKDIADALNYPLSTVSAALNDYYKAKRISEKKRDYIKKVARDMGYVVDEMARAVKTGKSNTIVYATNFDSLETLSRVSSTVNARGYKLDLILPDEKLAEAIIAKRAAGALIHWSDDALKLVVKKLKKNGISCACSVNNAVGSDVWIYSDDTHGARLAADCLIKQDHKKFAVISSKANVCLQRARDFIQALEDNGVSFDRKLFLPDAADIAVVKAFVKDNLHSFPDAVFCTTNQEALMLCFYAEKYGINIPDDCAVIGYGGAYKRFFPITSILEKNEDIAAASANKLIDLIEGKSTGRFHKKYPTELYQGMTTKKED